MKVFPTPGLHGIELWRGIASGVPVSHFQGRTCEYFTALRKFLVDLHRGKATGGDEADTQKLLLAEGFDRLVVGGGTALDPMLAPTLLGESLPFKVQIDQSGPYAARQGALHIFASKGWSRGIALDLGQMQLKVITTSSEFVLPRDLAQLPFGAHALPASLGRARLRSLLPAGLSLIKQGPPDGVVLALPVALGSDGVADPATYPGLYGPVETIFADLFPCPSVVLNDAVLVGLGFPPKARGKTLIVTLGFGIGGALWAE